MKKMVILLIVMLMVFFIRINSVNALENVTLIQDVIENLYYTRRGGGKPYASLPYKTFTIGEKAVYCIEPGIEIITNSYFANETLNKSPFSDEINRLIELIGYYGYDYPNHQTLKYRMAAQALIWEKTGGQIIEFWTERYGYGDYIDVSKEKNEIMKLVNNHQNKPSFHQKDFNIVLGSELELIDTNKLLANFIILEDSINAEIKDNTLIIKPNKVGIITLNLSKKRYDDERSIIYIGSNPKTQKMGFFRFSEDVISTITINVLAGSISINKLDYDTKSEIPVTNKATLKDAKYGIYNEKEELITTIITDEKGYAQSEQFLSMGKYYLKEISPSKGYTLDETKYYFEINEDNLEVNLSVYEKIINCDIEIEKFLKNKQTNILEKEPGIKFVVYDDNNKYITEIITNEDGYAKVNLIYGTYLFKQINTTSGYQKVDDFKVIVDEKSQNIIKYSLINLPIEMKIKVIKKDYDSKKPILQEGITFKIRNLDTNLDVCYYDKINKICEFKTDKNGEFITHNLISGNYQIEELIAPIGYVINKNPYKFRIDENSNIINDQFIGDYFSMEIYNEKIKGSIKVLKKGEILINRDNNFFYDYTNLPNISFSIYAKEDIITNDGIIYYKKDELINTLKTDNNGNLIFNNLYLGKYYMKENSVINDYIKNERIYEFELNNNNFNHEIIIYNYLQKGNLKIIKKDSDTNEVIPNTTIALYNEFDECLFVDKTNNKGIINIDNLTLGRYYLKEEISANGYLLNDEKIYFDLEDSDKTYEIVMLNEKIMIDVPDTNINKKYIVEIIALICIVVGMGFLVYGRRKI